MIYPRRFFGFGELYEYSFYKSLFAEFFGSFLLVFLGITATLTDDTGYRELIISLCFGFLIATLVLALGPISGCHLNPAITFAMIFVRQVTFLRGFTYIICQWLGALVGAAVIYAITMDKKDVGVTKLNPQLGAAQGILMETMITTLLVLVVLSVTDKCRFGLKSTSSIAIGLAMTATHLAAIRYTGASMNPFRSFAPAVVNGYYKYWYIYWIGPFLGAFIAVVIYKFVLKPVPTVVQIEGQDPYNYEYYNWF